MNECKVIDKLRQHDEKTMTEVYLRYFRLLKHVAFQILRNEDESEDIAQEAFIKAGEKIQSLKEGASLVSWLCAISKNLAYDRVREKERFTSEPLPDIEDCQNVSPDTYAAARSLLETIDSLFNEETRDIVIYRAALDLSFKDIAALKNKTVSSVIGIYHRSLRLLKEHLKDKK